MAHQDLGKEEECCKKLGLSGLPAHSLVVRAEEVDNELARSLLLAGIKLHLVAREYPLCVEGLRHFASNDIHSRSKIMLNINETPAVATSIFISTP